MDEATRQPSDPNFTASLYASGHLDALITDVVAPLRDALANHDDSVRIWAIRYSRRGEHLKLRVHTSLAAAHVEARLRELALPCFDRLPALTDDERIARFDVPVIDAEDEGDSAVADRSLVVTRYRRSEITLGGAITLGDVALIDAIYRAMASGFERFLDLVDSDSLAERRLNLFFGALIDGLHAAIDHPRDRITYLDYHRDWLLRVFVQTTAEEARLRQQFERRAAVLVPKLAPATRRPESSPSAPWPRALTQVQARLDDLPAELRLDPYATTAGDSIRFKVLHGVANSFGVHPLNEAFACHAVASAWSTSPRHDEATDRVLV